MATLEDRFWSKVRKGEGCWEWTASTTIHGYGKFWNGHRLIAAYRHAWEIANGPIPNGLWVLHRCDNRLCVRHDHLFLGTAYDNIHDMMNKGRRGYTGLRGEKNPKGKLSSTQVYEIRHRSDMGERPYTLAREYGVGWNSIHRIAKRLNWKHLPEADRNSTTVLTPGEY